MPVFLLTALTMLAFWDENEKAEASDGLAQEV